MKAILGTFVFSMETAIYDQISRNTSHRFSSKSRLHQRSIKHSLGPGDDNISLPGAIYPCVAGDPDSLDEIRDMMATGEPQQLINLQGELLGLWLIESVNETRSEFQGSGKPRVIEFDLSLARYD